MTDVVSLARMRRESLCIEIEALDRFIGTARLLLRSRDGSGRGSAEESPSARIEPLRPAARAVQATAARPSDPSRAGRPHLEPVRAQPTAPTESRAASLFIGDWDQDTFDFEALATGARP